MTNPGGIPAHPTECDLVMQGGITSGVAYPAAVLELYKTFRFRSIGGASAGAMAANSLRICEKRSGNVTVRTFSSSW